MLFSCSNLLAAKSLQQLLTKALCCTRRQGMAGFAQGPAPGRLLHDNLHQSLVVPFSHVPALVSTIAAVLACAFFLAESPTAHALTIIIPDSIQPTTVCTYTSPLSG